ncbi:MAG: VanZ family protein, partial [Blastococcus sp.]
MRSTLQVHGSLSRGTFALAVLVSLAVLFAPASDVPSTPPGVDKLVHATVFAALALSGRWAGLARGVLVPLLVLYAAASEVIQGLIGRDAAVGDLLADVVGVLLGLLAWQWLARRAVNSPDR